MSDGEEEDFFKDLDDDFEHAVSEPQEVIVNESETDIHEFEDDNIFQDIDDINHILRLIEKGENNAMYIKEILPIPRAISVEKSLENCSEPTNSNFLGNINRILNYVKNGLSIGYSEMVEIYKIKFPEIASIIPNSYQYAMFVSFLETTSIEDLQQVVPKFESIFNINKELSLVLSMSLSTDFQKNVRLDEDSHKRILRLVAIISELNELEKLLTSKISSMVLEMAPNLCALIGQETATQLISHTGGLLQLSKIPGCNLENIGGKNMKENKSGSVNSFSKQRGYIWHSQIVQEQPLENHKQLIRMLCSKVALAARVDAGQHGKSRNNDLGIKWKSEILEKIVKLKNPPNLADVKALPIPEDKPKKKRAGRKFRKYKEQFKLSQARQLQNRMEFGKQEKTVLDAYGEEIGLGMSTSGFGKGLASTPTVTTKVSKTLKRKLNEVNSTTQEYFNTINDNETVARKTDKKLKTTNTKDWYQNHL